MVINYVDDDDDAVVDYVAIDYIDNVNAIVDDVVIDDDDDKTSLN